MAGERFGGRGRRAVVTGLVAGLVAVGAAAVATAGHAGSERARFGAGHGTSFVLTTPGERALEPTPDSTAEPSARTASSELVPTTPPAEEPPPGVRVAGIQVDRTVGAPDPAPSVDPVPLDPTPADPAPGTACPGPADGPFVAAHNAARCAAGTGPLVLDPSVSEHAQFQADRLMTSGACASLWHSPELGAWYTPGFWGENAACVQWAGGCWGDLSLVMNGWIASPEHAPNVFNPNFRAMGVGIACDGRHTYFVVQFRS